MIIIGMAVWNCLTIPLDYAFDFQSVNAQWYKIIDTIIDVFFVFDILITFRTTYIKSSGKEIVKPIKIAANYIKGRFILDFLSVFPFTYFSDSPLMALFGLFKVMRITRLNKIIDQLNMKEDQKMMLKLIKLFFFLVLFVHVSACTWFWIISLEKKWMPPLDWMYLESDLFESSNSKMFWTSLYHSVLMLNANELGPRTELELLFVGSILILGAIINANLFGNMAVIIQELSEQQMRF